MSAHMISYDLGKPGRDYDDLYIAIKNLANGWWHCLESVWIVITDLSPAEIRDALAPYLDSNDKLVVLTLEGDWATQNVSKECSDWLRNHL